jgi:leukotriene-A4 hydrolase
MPIFARLFFAGALTLSLGSVGATALLDPAHDYHSNANTHEFRVTHADLALDVDFDARRLSGTVDLTVERLAPESTHLILDTRDLVIREVWIVAGTDMQPCRFSLGVRDPILGSPLDVEMPVAAAGASQIIRISYQTSPDASGLQWLTPAQTAGKRHPFLLTQSEAIHARSWIPLQDTPQVRLTYSATVHTPADLRALMSATNDPQAPRNGWYRFDMPQPIPSYLIALAVGDLEFRRIGPRTGVYADPSLVVAAAREFEDVESMVHTGESLFGPYRWGRYDILVLPPAFPYGGMENPRLTFITPGLIAGDKSLVSVIAHELAHSWSGNLVTNATWRDVWLNEGFTVFLESKIMRAVYGDERAAMEDVLGLHRLQEDFAQLPPEDQRLAIDFRGRDPDDLFSDVPYEKGRLFLAYLESRFGTDAFTAFLHGYFDRFAFQSRTQEQFISYLKETLVAANPSAVSAAEIDRWLNDPGLPPGAVLPSSDLLERVDAQRSGWLAGRTAAAAIATRGWSTQEWVRLIENMPATAPVARIAELDAAFHLSFSHNAEIEAAWLRQVVIHKYPPALAQLQDYLSTHGRIRHIKPLYEELIKSEWGREFARRVYPRVRESYHPILQGIVDGILKSAPG